MMFELVQVANENRGGNDTHKKTEIRINPMLRLECGFSTYSEAYMNLGIEKYIPSVPA